MSPLLKQTIIETKLFQIVLYLQSCSTHWVNIVTSQKAMAYARFLIWNNTVTLFYQSWFCVTLWHRLEANWKVIVYHFLQCLLHCSTQHSHFFEDPENRRDPGFMPKHWVEMMWHFPFNKYVTFLMQMHKKRVALPSFKFCVIEFLGNFSKMKVVLKWDEFSLSQCF